MTNPKDQPRLVSPASEAMDAHTGDQRAAWSSLWQREQTFWDLGRAHPSLPRLLAGARATTGFDLEGRRIYVPGCGRGHEAAWLAGEGAIVDAADYSLEALGAARRCYPEADSLRFLAEDAFARPDPAARRYDAVIDRAMLCAIDPGDRRRYLEACAFRLRPGGVFLSVAFESVRVAAGPPFAVTRHELLGLCAASFDLVHAESQPTAGMEDFIHSELLVVLKRR